MDAMEEQTTAKTGAGLRVWAELGCGEDAGEDFVDVAELAMVVEGGGELLRR